MINILKRLFRLEKKTSLRTYDYQTIEAKIDGGNYSAILVYKADTVYISQQKKSTKTAFIHKCVDDMICDQSVGITLGSEYILKRIRLDGDKISVLMHDINNVVTVDFDLDLNFKWSSEPVGIKRTEGFIE